MFRKNQKNDNLIYADTGSPEGAPAPRKKDHRRLAAAMVALTVALAAAVGVMTLGISLRGREDRYSAAKDLVDEKYYEEALLVFDDLGDYRDSRDQAQQLRDKQAAYDNATDLLEQQRYEEALGIYRSLGDYADSAQQAAYYVNYRKALDLMTEIDTGKTRLLTRILAEQVKLTDERSYPTIVGYETAAALLESLGDYRTAAALADRCYYSAGLVKLGWEDWDGALAYLDRMSEETAAEFFEEYQRHYNEKTQEGR
ncbi:MAG: hypothetical protein IJZ39_03645 [Oscillospiraceae bacterium]|nr:hypothetical protein [Oscillospiraceae bacterium]